MAAPYGPPVYRTQGATALVVDAGGTLDITSGKVNLPGNLRKGFIPLDMFSARILSSGENFIGANFSATGVSLGASIGGLLHSGSVPALVMNSTLQQAAMISWASGQTQALAFPPVPIPPDFSSAGGLVINAFAERASDNSSDNVIDMRFWNSTNATEMGTTGATISTTPGRISVTVSSAESGRYPGVWNIQFVPGTHTNNAVRIFAAHLEYTRASS